MARSPLLVIAAGGTGGHMFPAQALAEEMLARGWRVRLATDARGAAHTGGYPDAVAVDVLTSATFSRGGVLARLVVPVRILGGVLVALRRFRADRPDVVVGFGGYPAIPAMAAAWALRLPRMIHEQNGVLGRVNQLFARRVDRVACGTWPTVLPAGVESVFTGNPVRAAVRARAGASYDLPATTGPVSLLVFGGSQGARVLSDTVPEAVAALPDALRARLRIAQQARPEDADRVAARYDALGVPAEVAPFFADIPDRLVAAQLVVARAGASSVADIAAVGRPAIFVPLASAIRDEQTANARGLVEAGAASVIQEGDLDPGVLSDEIARILGTPDTAAAMAAAARQAGRPDAAERLAALVETLGGMGQTDTRRTDSAKNEETP